MQNTGLRAAALIDAHGVGRAPTLNINGQSRGFGQGCRGGARPGVRDPNALAVAGKEIGPKRQITVALVDDGHIKITRHTV